MKKLLKTRIGAIVLTGCIMTTTFLAVPASVVPVEAKTKYVYIAASGNGTKYHSNKECSRMRGKVKKVKAKAFVYRIHDVPNSDKLSNFADIASRFGYKVKTQGSVKEVNRNASASANRQAAGTFR